MAQRRVFAGDTRSTEQRTQVTADVHRGVGGDHLAQADLFGANTRGVLELAQVGCQQGDLRVLAKCLCQFLLRDLKCREWLVELDT